MFDDKKYVGLSEAKLQGFLAGLEISFKFQKPTSEATDENVGDSQNV